jgi:hypothetical protein
VKYRYVSTPNLAFLQENLLNLHKIGIRPESASLQARFRLFSLDITPLILG